MASTDLSALDGGAPHARLLSNGRYRVLVSGGGSGASNCDGYALTAWTGDRTEDGEGLFVYLRDRDSGAVWSATRQPVRGNPSAYQASYSPGVVTIERHDHGVASRLEIAVAPEDNLEVRRLRLANHSTVKRRLEVTSYAEIALLDPAGFAAHPAFAKLFVQTEFVAEPGVLLARRRPRSNGEQHPWMVHALVGSGELQHETDRARFVGRGRNRRRPRALATSEPLAGTSGNVLDPIFSLRRFVDLEPGGEAEFVLLLGCAPSRRDALGLVEGNLHRLAQLVFDRAHANELALCQELGIATPTADAFQAIAGALLYRHPRLRATPAISREASKPFSELNPSPIGDGLVALLSLDSASQLARVSELLQARDYWRRHALDVNVIVLCPDSLADSITALVESTAADDGRRPIVLPRSELTPEQADLWLVRADLVMDESVVSLAEKLRPALASLEQIEPAPYRQAVQDPGEPSHPAPAGLQFANGFGGFSADGREYCLYLPSGESVPPLPWVNVVANEQFGFLVSERGAGYTWNTNSRQNRLTVWSNDPVSDPASEAFFVRDEDAQTYWSPMPAPLSNETSFEVRHGFGYSTWYSRAQGLDQEVTMFVPQSPSEPVKLTRIRLHNHGSRRRRLSLYSYARLVMGVGTEIGSRFIETERDSSSGAILARNRTNDEFAGDIAFAAIAGLDGPAVSFTTDRRSFLGFEGELTTPSAIRQDSLLDGRCGAGPDPCFALQTAIELAPGESVERTFLLGAAPRVDDVRFLCGRYESAASVDASLERTKNFWSGLVGKVRVSTPSPELDLMLNGWLAYQALSCRIWGRSAYYQSGGAFGFRDQLQDAAALVHLDPALTRSQILLHAAHQFDEGDVLHWWHPPADRGIRTKFSDDLLWLPFLTAFYVRHTGDWTVLDESAPFRTARLLEAGEDEAYLISQPSGDFGSVYEHCCRALDRSLRVGAHGIPLMGTGDWNDGMNRVGREGRGESIWMGFFLFRILSDFLPICERRGDSDRVDRYRSFQETLPPALETAGWDGAWYRRAYYDDGSPLGSSTNQECRIDALAQAWSVISNAVPRKRADAAMDSAMKLLVSEPEQLIRLLTPPFDSDPHDPGYIKGYLPGIRENGGQYTHAALWVVQALAELGRRNDAARLLRMVSPVSHTSSREQVDLYQGEPYVIAADIYGAEPHIGRVGWTWYTGAAGWMLRVGIESILGIRLEQGRELILRPCIPDSWPEFRVDLTLPDGRTRYEIVVLNPSGCSQAIRSIRLDGKEAGEIAPAEEARLSLLVDEGKHRVEVRLGAST